MASIFVSQMILTSHHYQHDLMERGTLYKTAYYLLNILFSQKNHVTKLRTFLTTIN